MENKFLSDDYESARGGALDVDRISDRLWDDLFKKPLTTADQIPDPIKEGVLRFYANGDMKSLWDERRAHFLKGDSMMLPHDLKERLFNQK